tara:strand:- start:2495 stop:2695 length:201 start_codon:yes stop_codon:yes gene_type:complete
MVREGVFSDEYEKKRKPNLLVRIWIAIKCSLVSSCCSKETIKTIEVANGNPNSQSNLTKWQNMSIV